VRAVIVALRVMGRELRGVRDVVVRADRDHTIADLCTALAAHLGVAVPGLITQRTAQVVPATMSVSACGLVSGDAAVIGTAADVVIDIVDGAQARTSNAVGPGRWVIGRGAAAHIVLADPTVSRRHAEIEVTDDRVTLSAIGPVFVEGSPVQGARLVDPGEVI